jgi:hypothetical protein
VLLPIYQKYMGYEFSAVALNIWIVIVKLLFGFSVKKIEAFVLRQFAFFFVVYLSLKFCFGVYTFFFQISKQ